MVLLGGGAACGLPYVLYWLCVRGVPNVVCVGGGDRAAAPKVLCVGGGEVGPGLRP